MVHRYMEAKRQQAAARVLVLILVGMMPCLSNTDQVKQLHGNEFVGIAFVHKAASSRQAKTLITRLNP